MNSKDSFLQYFLYDFSKLDTGQLQVIANFCIHKLLNLVVDKFVDLSLASLKSIDMVTSNTPLYLHHYTTMCTLYTSRITFLSQVLRLVRLSACVCYHHSKML